MLTDHDSRHDFVLHSVVLLPMTTPATSPNLASRLRRLAGAAGFAFVAAATISAPALADGRAGRVPTAHTKRPASSTVPTARERARARAAKALARTRAADHRVEHHVAVIESADARAARVAAAERADRMRDSVVRMARAQIGVPYVLGGAAPDSGFDCSGLVKYVMSALHVRLPRTAAEQSRAGTRVARDPSRLRPGDLVTFASRGEGVSHIGIYVGNGRMVHASTTAHQVIETELVRPAFPTIKPWRGVRRVVAASSDVVDSTRH